MNRTANRRRAEADSTSPHEANDRGIVFMAVGVPGSGKSTFLGELASSQGIPVVSSDAIRHELTGSEADLTSDGDVWELFDDRVEAQIREGQSVVLDSTNLERERRVRAIERYRHLGARSIVAVVFDIPFDVALARNEKRGLAGGRCVPYHAMRRMHGQLQSQPVTLEEGFDDVVRVDTTH